ncbi:GILT-like protein 1 [Toxorhynchites rutilus septentrionalis]|uniref:GILT-like protein 1 n=1 Tax=Toxorhynchites rutilus septentrionalis TaxID=329112 RepID=UPI0024793B0F|nr:GILT-like protein 1 [Toxorhynchites rutilus septentrionalis]
MLKYILLVSLFVAFSHAQSKVPVYVYYESLCPDSAKFINQQLYPVAKQFKDNLDLKLIPFGKSSYRTQGSDVLFECHHGPNECHGNKVHACALYHIQGNSFQPNNTKEVLTLEYVNCLMERAQLKSGEFPGKVCADMVEIHNWETIEQCANNTEGSGLLKNYGDETAKLQQPLKSVPTIAFRQSFDSDNQKLSLENFRAALCKNLSPSPVQCRNLPGSAPAIASVGLVTIVSVILTRLF